MKSLHKLFPSIFLICCMLTSCYKLDRYPQDRLSSGTFWQSEDQLKQAIAACYQSMKWQEVYWRFFGMDCISDIGIGYDDAGYIDISRGIWTPRTGYVTNRWQQTYEGVARVNNLIRNVTEMDVDAESKQLVIAEARFLRALYYNFLLVHFGGVPLYDETTDYNQDYLTLQKTRATADETRAFIIADLQEAIQTLPVAWPTSDYGRATKGAAHALLGKVYLYNEEYKLAATEFEEIVMDPNGLGYGYSLYPNYADLFKDAGDESSEMIFAVQNYGVDGFALGMPYAHFMGSNAAIGTSWNNVMPSPELVDSYELKDGRPFDWDDFIPGYNDSREIREKTLRATLTPDFKSVATYPEFHDELLAMYDQRDPRMQETIILPYTHYLGFIANEEKMTEFVYATGVAIVNGFTVVNRYNNASNYMYLFRKFVPEGNLGGALPPSFRANVPVNFPIIRFADVLLMLAECYNEEGRTDEAVALINRVRQRPSTNMPAINSGPQWLEAHTKEAVFERIKHERAVEFAAEGLRYYDLRRWGLIQDVMNKDVTDAMGNLIYTTKFDNKDLLWPIPAVEIEMNPNLTQNPGW